jgi:hypothetical protein
MKIERPQSWLEGLFDGRMMNPIQFLEKKEQRLDLLLSSLDLKFDADALREDVGHSAESCIVDDEYLHPLQQIAACRRAILDRLHDTKVEQQSKSATASEMSANLPDVVPEDFAKQIEDLEEQIKLDESNLWAAKSEEESKCDKIRYFQREIMTRRTEENKREFQKKSAEMRSDVEKKISEMREEFLEKDQEVFDECKKTIEIAKCDRDQKIEQLPTKEVVEKREKLTQMRFQNDASVKARALTEQVEKLKFEADELSGTVDNLKIAVTVIDEHKREMAKDLPIPGLEVDGKNILLDGVMFDQLNKQKQIEIAVKIACIRAKDFDLPLILVDNAECLDSENLGHLIDAIKAEGAQAVIGYRTDGDFKVEGR